MRHGDDAIDDGQAQIDGERNKTRTRVLPDGAFDFLGYTFGRCYNHRTGAAYLAASPAKKKIAKLCDAIQEQTSSRRTRMDEEEMVGRLNRKLRGWANYFDLGSVSRGIRGELPRNESATSMAVPEA